MILSRLGPRGTVMIGLLYNEAQVAQTTLTYILTVHRNEEIPIRSDHKQ